MSYYWEFTLRSHGVRRDGSAALDLCSVACGRFEAFWEFGLNSSDTAAGILIVTEAGGRVTDLAGALTGRATAKCWLPTAISTTKCSASPRKLLIVQQSSDVTRNFAQAGESAMLLEGKVAVITGGGRGIGRAIARRFAAEGAEVAVTARTAAEVDQVAAEIRRTGGQATSITADVSREADCEKLCASRARRSVDPHSGEQCRRLRAGAACRESRRARMGSRHRRKFRGPFLLSRLVLPEMYERGSGAILNIVSIAAKVAFTLNSAYAASKAGLIGLTHTLAAESARKVCE